MRDIFMKENCRGGKNFIFITSLWFITLTYKAVQLNNLDFIIISFHWRPININSKIPISLSASWSVIKHWAGLRMRLLRQSETRVRSEEWGEESLPRLSIGGQAGCCEAGAASVLPLSSRHQRILPRPRPPLPHLVLLETIFYFTEHLHSWYQNYYDTMSLFWILSQCYGTMTQTIN